MCLASVFELKTDQEVRHWLGGILMVGTARCAVRACICQVNDHSRTLERSVPTRGLIGIDKIGLHEAAIALTVAIESGTRPKAAEHCRTPKRGRHSRRGNFACV